MALAQDCPREQVTTDPLNLQSYRHRGDYGTTEDHSWCRSVHILGRIRLPCLRALCRRAWQGIHRPQRGANARESLPSSLFPRRLRFRRTCSRNSHAVSNRIGLHRLASDIRFCRPRVGLGNYARSGIGRSGPRLADVIFAALIWVERRCYTEVLSRHALGSKDPSGHLKIDLEAHCAQFGTVVVMDLTIICFRPACSGSPFHPGLGFFSRLR